jgi:hypothetical protein
MRYEQKLNIRVFLLLLSPQSSSLFTSASGSEKGVLKEERGKDPYHQTVANERGNGAGKEMNKGLR